MVVVVVVVAAAAEVAAVRVWMCHWELARLILRATCRGVCEILSKGNWEGSF